MNNLKSLLALTLSVFAMPVFASVTLVETASISTRPVDPREYQTFKNTKGETKAAVLVSNQELELWNVTRNIQEAAVTLGIEHKPQTNVHLHKVLQTTRGVIAIVEQEKLSFNATDLGGPVYAVDILKGTTQLLVPSATQTNVQTFMTRNHKTILALSWSERTTGASQQKFALIDPLTLQIIASVGAADGQLSLGETAQGEMRAMVIRHEGLFLWDIAQQSLCEVLKTDPRNESVSIDPSWQFVSVHGQPGVATRVYSRKDLLEGNVKVLRTLTADQQIVFVGQKPYVLEIVHGDPSRPALAASVILRDFASDVVLATIPAGFGVYEVSILPTASGFEFLLGGADKPNRFVSGSRFMTASSSNSNPATLLDATGAFQTAQLASGRGQLIALASAQTATLTTHQMKVVELNSNSVLLDDSRHVQVSRLLTLSDGRVISIVSEPAQDLVSVVDWTDGAKSVPFPAGSISGVAAKLGYYGLDEAAIIKGEDFVVPTFVSNDGVENVIGFKTFRLN